MTNCNTNNLRSIGGMASDYGVSLSKLQRAADKAGVKPTVTMDGVKFFDADAADRIRTALLRNKLQAVKA